MAKWDTFVDMLKEYYLEEFTTILYEAQKMESKEKPMKQIILEAAKKWRIDKPYQVKEIMTQVIETLAIENIEEQNKILRSINAELKAKSEELSLVDEHTYCAGKQIQANYNHRWTDNNWEDQIK